MDFLEVSYVFQHNWRRRTEIMSYYDLSCCENFDESKITITDQARRTRKTIIVYEAQIRNT